MLYRILRSLVPAVLMLVCTGPGWAADGPPFSDTLVYANRTAMEQVWQPARPGTDREILVAAPDGIGFTDITGDCWQDANTQRAVFLRTPRYDGAYAYEVTLRDFLPVDIHAQVGLVAWWDPDNYIRGTGGFIPPRFESVAETEGRTGVGFWPLEPRRERPASYRLRTEVRPGSIRTYASFDGDYWIELGSKLLTDRDRQRADALRIGILGVGNRMARQPRFTDWREAPLPDFTDDAFDGPRLGPQWRKGQTAMGWGADETAIEPNDGALVITPFSGSDITHEETRHVPYIAQGAPQSDTWELEARIRSFPADTPGRWHRAGLLLWQDRDHFVHVSVVADDGLDHMNLEALGFGARAPAERPIRFGGFGPRRDTPAILRAARIAPDRYRFRASYDGTEWVELGEVDIPLTDPEVRLYACSDQTMSEKNRTRFPVAFDSLRRLDAPAP